MYNHSPLDVTEENRKENQMSSLRRRMTVIRSVRILTVPNIREEQIMLNKQQLLITKRE